MTFLPTPPRVIARLLSKTEEAGDCVLSLYSTASHGYSQVGWVENGKTIMRLGHRVAWEAEHGPIPDGMTIDHTCRTRRCIKITHLRLLPNVVNATDNGNRGRRTEAVSTGRLCGKGLHDLLRYPSGAVSCRECANERYKAKVAKRGRRPGR